VTNAAYSRRWLSTPISALYKKRYVPSPDLPPPSPSAKEQTKQLRENLAFAAKAAGHSTEDEAVRVRGAIPATRRFCRQT
jgi:hypothetical protein